MMPDADPYHEGERAVQELAGERATAEKAGRVIGGAVPEKARSFLGAQTMLVVGSVDEAGTPWPSLLFGTPGFVRAEEAGRALALELGATVATPADLLWSNLATHPRVGVLAIELTSRRRLRVNGRIEAYEPGVRLRIAVEEAYPNCPKYIQRRAMSRVPAASSASTTARVERALDAEQWAWIRRADTLFLATADASGRVDASHRGGEPGFVERKDEATLRIPDYPGNSMFNTLGNIRERPSAGLLFPDFDGDRILQVSGPARLRFGADDPGGATAGTGRFWEVCVECVRDWRLGAAPGWRFLDASPFNPVAADGASALDARAQ